MIISKKKRNSEEFKRLFCTGHDENQEELTRADIKRILLNACAATEKVQDNSSIEIVEDDSEIEIVEENACTENLYEEEEEELNFDMGKITVTDEEIADYIVENPREVVVNFPLNTETETAEVLPFFKSVMAKLANA